MLKKKNQNELVNHSYQSSKKNDKISGDHHNGLTR